MTNTVIATIPIGQSPQALTYVPEAVPDGDGMQGLQPLGAPGEAAHLTLVPAAGAAGGGDAPTSVAVYEKGLVQMLEAAVTGLQPMPPYLLALSLQPDGSGPPQPLAELTTHAAGAQIVTALGPIRAVVQAEGNVQRRAIW